jgi:probable HAF family extracellular repeat protein
MKSKNLFHQKHKYSIQILLGLLIINLSLFFIANDVLAVGFLKDGEVVTPFDFPGANWNETRALGINDNGQIVGQYIDGSGGHGFLKDGDTFTSFDFPGAMATSAYGINDNGQIVGDYLDASLTRHAFLKDGDIFTAIVPPGAISAIAYGINNNGQIVGYYRDATSRIIRGFLKDGEVVTPFDFPGAEWTSAHGINDNGQIVGTYSVSGGDHAFLKDGDIFTAIVPPGAISAYAYGINNSGQIVGTSSDGSGAFPAFLKDGGTFTIFDFSEYGTWAADINNNGQIVGYYQTPLIAINVRPEDDANRINLRSNGKVAVAILSTLGFDAVSQVDQTSLTFGSTGDEQSLISCKPKPKDINHDGSKDDLVCRFDTQMAGFKCGDTEGILKGLTKDGTPIEGKDLVNIVKCK